MQRDDVSGTAPVDDVRLANRNRQDVSRAQVMHQSSSILGLAHDAIKCVLQGHTHLQSIVRFFGITVRGRAVTQQLEAFRCTENYGSVTHSRFPCCPGSQNGRSPVERGCHNRVISGLYRRADWDADKLSIKADIRQ